MCFFCFSFFFFWGGKSVIIMLWSVDLSSSFHWVHTSKHKHIVSGRGIVTEHAKFTSPARNCLATVGTPVESVLLLIRTLSLCPTLWKRGLRPLPIASQHPNCDSNSTQASHFKTMNRLKMTPKKQQNCTAHHHFKKKGVRSTSKGHNSRSLGCFNSACPSNENSDEVD